MSGPRRPAPPHGDAPEPPTETGVEARAEPPIEGRAEATPEPAAAGTPAPASEPSSSTAARRTRTSTKAAATPEPALEATPEPAAAPTREPAFEATLEPAAAPTPEPAAPIPEPAPEPSSSAAAARRTPTSTAAARPDEPPPSEPIESSITPLISTLTLGGRIFCRGISRMRFEGAVNEIPKHGPVILAANHASNLDAVAIGSWIIPRLGRRIHWLGKKELFAWPLVGWAAANGGVHPVDRDAADVEAFRLAKRILDEGHVLFVFPEGTRSPDGALQEARDGVAVLAMRTGAPIVPIGISGSYRIWPRGQKLPHPGGHVTVRVGRPFRLADVLPAGTDRRTAKGLATTLIMERIAALLPQVQRGIYGLRPPMPPD